jgi:hypothetical protein
MMAAMVDTLGATGKRKAAEMASCPHSHRFASNADATSGQEVAITDGNNKGGRKSKRKLVPNTQFSDYVSTPP